MDINSAGNAVGYAYGGTEYTAMFWSADGVAEIIDAGYARAINDAGIVVGQRIGAPDGGAVAWTRNGGVWTQHTLPRQAGVTAGFNEVDDINNAGVIVGYAEGADGIQHAVKWLPSTTTPGTWDAAVPLDALAAITNSAALGIEGGDVVGIIWRCVGCAAGRDPRHWSLSGSSIGSLGSEDAWPEGLNGALQIVGAHGISRGMKFNTRAFVWSPADPRIQDLPLPDGYSDALAYDINNAAPNRPTKHVVGYIETARGVRSAALWNIP